MSALFGHTGTALRAGMLLLSVAASTASIGCDTDAYCFDCEADDTSSASGTQSGAGGSAGTFGPVSSASSGFGPGGSCQADTLTDPKNCGLCDNVCEIANAFPVCEGGFCLVDHCASGWIDLNEMVVDGCEYNCTPSNGGQEICDGLDNDCNGEIDELFDTTSDEFNCGTCNNVCAFNNAGASCISSACSMASCLVGYHDIDGDPTTGCEYACTETNGGTEACDNVDNDCDASVDEGFDLTVDPLNCGQCGRNCSTLYPNTVPTCDQSQCVMGPCVAGFFDIDGNQLNGCEYACNPAQPGSEICDGQDNDCNGVKDDGVLPGIGVACGATDEGECAFGTTQCLLGAPTCVGAITPSAELCDERDNDCNGIEDDGCPSARSVDIRLDVGSGSAVAQANTTQLHVTSLANVVLATYLDRRSGSAVVRSNISTTGGSSWLAASDLEVAAGVEPYAALSPARAYVGFGQFVAGNVRQVRVARAASPFTTFAASVRIDHRGATEDSFFPRLVVAKPGAQDTLVAVWETISGTGAATQTNIYLQRSIDSGATWLASDLQVNAVAGVAETPGIATDGNGRVFLVWRDQRAGKSEVYGATYDATTGSLSANMALSGGHPAEQIVVAADQGGPNVYIAWTDLRAGKKAIRMNRSADGGASFLADGALVNTDSTFADAGKPDVSAASGRVAIAWEDTRSGKSDIRVKVSTDAGATLPATGARADLGDVAGTTEATAPRVALGDGQTVFLVWEDARNGRRDIYANHSFDDGAAFQPIDLRLDVGQPGALSPPGGADSRSPFIFATQAGTRGVSVWLDNRRADGTNGPAADVYASFIE